MLGVATQVGCLHMSTGFDAETLTFTAVLYAGVYMLVLCGAAVLLDSAGLTVKPW